MNFKEIKSKNLIVVWGTSKKTNLDQIEKIFREKTAELYLVAG